MMIMKMEMDVERDIDMDLPTMLTAVPTPTPAPTTTTTTANKDRAQLSQEAHGSIATRTVDDEETLLEVDHMILDHLLHQAITICLDNAHKVDTRQVDHALSQVDEFRQLFTTRHPNYTFDPELRFRQLLLQLIALTTQRFVLHDATPPQFSLDALRERNGARTRGWIENASQVPTATYDATAFDTTLPVSKSILLGNRANFLRSLKLPTNTTARNFYGSSQSVSLLDLLPLFMRVSATSCETLCSGNVNAQWMRLASEWMLQACLEQYLVYGASGCDAVDEAFAWGYKRHLDDGGDSSINAIFEHSQYAEEVEGWSLAKKRALDEILMHGEEDIRSHLARVSERKPMKAFVESLMGFLKPLSQTIPEPVLVQLEKGKLEGMSKEDTREFLRDCGVGVDSFGAP